MNVFRSTMNVCRFNDERRASEEKTTNWIISCPGARKRNTMSCSRCGAKKHLAWREPVEMPRSEERRRSVSSFRRVFVAARPRPRVSTSASARRFQHVSASFPVRRFQHVSTSFPARRFSAAFSSSSSAGESRPVCQLTPAKSPVMTS